MGSKDPYVYMMSDGYRGMIYIGVTSNLPLRVWQHKNHITGGFTTQFRLHKLVWYETFPSIIDAIHREKSLKGWNRKWKIHLIEKMNPYWKDLYPQISAPH
jgi:putative endonuclease